MFAIHLYSCAKDRNNGVATQVLYVHHISNKRNPICQYDLVQEWKTDTNVGE